MVQVSNVAGKITPAKRTIKVNNIVLADSRLVDEDGDITQEIIDNLPEGIETISFKITVELPEESL